MVCPSSSNYGRRSKLASWPVSHDSPIRPIFAPDVFPSPLFIVHYTNPTVKSVTMPIKILLVDDNQDFRSFLRRLLEKDQDFSVVGEASDGLEAIDRVHALPPDIILMDLAMPRLNGLESTQAIKAERPETKVIIFTQYQEDAYRRAAAEYGADAFLPKTTGLADLLAIIRQLTEGDPDEPKPIPPPTLPAEPEVPSSG